MNAILLLLLGPQRRAVVDHVYEGIHHQAKAGSRKRNSLTVRHGARRDQPARPTVRALCSWRSGAPLATGPMSTLGWGVEPS